MKHRLVAPPPKIKPPVTPEFDGLRVVLGPTGGLVALTRHGLEIQLTLDLSGLNKLHEMLVEQQRKKEIGAFEPIARLCLAEWTRIGPHGAGKRHKDVPLEAVPIPDL